MQSGWFARIFFGVVMVLGVAGIVSGTACTRWGQPGPLSPTPAPLASIFVNANTGSDTSGNGSDSKPYKTLTKAVAVVGSSKALSPSVTIYLAAGDYDTANGETFPIVIPTGLSINGAGYGSSPKNGAFINGSGEDLLFEQLVHAAPHSAFTTIEAASPAKLSLQDLYVGASTIKLPGSKAFYASVDVLDTTVNVTEASLGAGIVSSLRNVNGVIVPGGSFSCTSCSIRGNDFGIGAFAVPVATASPYSTGPSIILSSSGHDSDITAKEVDLLTDGNVNLNVEGVHFEKAMYAYADALTPVTPVTLRGIVDFGGGAASSPGGNVFIGARTSEIYVIRRNETVSALDDTWNPNQQRANRGGLYVRQIIFASGAAGKNVTVRHDAIGSTVAVGPATPTPTSTPSGSPTATPTP